ncbi:MAG: tetratricopeptide repeat protein [Phycisphaerales bacterium]|nr:tetratricopeptide repeat protein [Phycisphaerales bacterium]
MLVRLIVLSSVLLATIVPGARVAGQLEPGVVETQSVHSLFAQELTRRAVAPLHVPGELPVAWYDLSAELLDLAAEISGDDPDVLRLMIQAAQWAGDDLRVTDGTVRLTVADPTDIIAQLRLVATHIRRRQHSDDRLAAYERLLSEAGERLDRTIRSRMAYDAALLRRERGEIELCEQRLADALRLDSTNKQAAALAVALHETGFADPVEQARKLIQLFRADPIDSGTRLALAKLLLEHGAYEGSLRFLNSEFSFRTLTDQDIDASLYRDHVLAQWGAGYPDQALRFLDGMQELITQGEQRRQLSELLQEIEEAKKYELPYEEIDRNKPPFLDVVVDLPLELEWTRLVIADSKGRDGMARSAARRIADALTEEIASASQALVDAPTAEMAKTIEADIRALTGELLLVRVLFGADLEDARSLLERYIDDPDVKASARDRFLGCVLLREGDLDAAVPLLEAAGPDDVIARLGLAAAHLQQGDEDKAIVEFAAVWSAEPGTLLGLYAKTRLERLIGRAVPAVSSTAVRLNRLMRDGVPDELLQIWADPSTVISLRAKPISTRLQYMDQPRLRMTLTNTSRFPLALGPEAPISSRLMLVPSIQLNGRDANAPFSPIIVDMQRRLRLGAHESLVIEVPLGASDIWELGYAMPGTNYMVTYRAMLDFGPTAGGQTQQFGPGPMGLSTDADTIISFKMPASTLTSGGLLARLDNAYGVEKLRLLSVAVALIAQPKGLPVVLDEDGVVRMRQGLLARFPELTDLQRGWVILRSTRMTGLGADSPIDAAAWRVGGELTTIALLATRLPSLDDPHLVAALDHESPRVREVARRVRDALLALPAQADASVPSVMP